MKEIIIKKNDLTIEKLNDYQESFIDYLDVDDKTLNAYKCGIKSLMNYLKDNGVKQPARDDVIGFRNYLRDNYSSNTVNMYMASVRALFKYLSIHHIYENIAVDIKGAKYDTTPKKEVIQLDKLKEITSNLTDLRERAIFELMITTGIRTCEVARACIEDIKEYNGEIVLFVLGKKRDSKDEYVKLSEQVLNDLKEYIGNRTSGSIFISTSNENYGEGISEVSIRKTIKNIFRRFGIDKDTISCHSLRRTCAVLSYETGSSIYDIKQVLRHSSIQTTTRYLQQVDRDKNKTEFNVSNVIFGG